MMAKTPSNLSIDLHRHLDGNISLATIIRLAQKNNITLPTYDLNTLAKLVHIQDKSSDLLAFLEKLDFGVSVLASAQDCFDIAYENVQGAIDEGLDHVELRFSPYYMAQSNSLNMHAVVESVVAGVQAANQDFNFNATLIGILSRTYGVDECAKELSALLSQSPHLVAVDLAGDENGFPAALFTGHFTKVKDAGLGVTIHAGEASGPQSIWDAILKLGATRIGHSVAAHQDPKLMAYMCEHKIGIESCLLSNYQTGTWTEIATHPIKTFLSHNIPVCLNTDDPGVSNNTLSSEYHIAKHTVGLNDTELHKCRANAFDMAFLDEGIKKRLVSH